MTLIFDENGVLTPPAPATTAEVNAVYDYAKAADPAKKGLSLSQLRQPSSTMSLQALERIVNTLTAAGKLTSVTQSGNRGGTFRQYFWV